MVDTVHVIGNGRSAGLFNESLKGVRITCNLPPFEIKDVYATAIVDFKMCRAIKEGSVEVPGMWVCGYRPKVYTQENPSWYMKHSKQIREFYTVLPDYVDGYTALNCGHLATHYSATKFSPKNIHLWGFDSMFDMDMTSCTDFYLESDRSAENTNRLANRWRAIWPNIFKEFPDIGFTLHGKHDKIKFNVPENVNIVVS